MSAAQKYEKPHFRTAEKFPSSESTKVNSHTQTQTQTQTQTKNTKTKKTQTQTADKLPSKAVMSQHR